MGRLDQYKIVVRHSSIIINNYDLGDCPKLEYFFSIYDKISHQYFFKGLEYIEEEKKLILPRGVDILFLENLFMAKAHIDISCDRFEKISESLIKYLPRNDVQKEALRFMLGEGEYSNLKPASQLLVNLNTGAGKTYLSIASIVYLSLRSIIIASRADWIKQWKNKILEYTDIEPSEIYVISGAASIYKLLNGMKDVSKIKIFLATHNTLKSYGDNKGWKEVSKLFKILKVGIKVYDEAHLNFDNICKIDFYTNTYKTYYLTATPGRSNSDENDIYQLSFKNVFAIDLFNEDKDPHTHYISIRFKSRPTPKEMAYCSKSQYGLDRNRYVGYLVKKEVFYKVLTIVMNIIKNIKGKVLIYIATNDAILTVREWLINNYPEIRNDIGIFTSIVKDEDKKAQLEKRIILSTTKSAGAAMDIPGLKATIVLAEPFKSEILARQSLGRTRSNNTLYIEVVDDSFAILRAFYNHKKPVYAKYALSCREIILTEDDLEDRYNKILEERKYIESLEPAFFRFTGNYMVNSNNVFARY